MSNLSNTDRVRTAASLNPVVKQYVHEHGQVIENEALERLVEAQECDSRSAPDLEVESLYAKVVRHSRESPPGHGSELEFDRERDREDETVSSSTPTR